MCIFFDKSKKLNDVWVYPSIEVSLENGDIVTFNHVQYVFLQGNYLEINTMENVSNKTKSALHNVAHFSVRTI